MDTLPILTPVPSTPSGGVPGDVMLDPGLEVWASRQLTGTGMDVGDAVAACLGAPRTDPAALALRDGFATATVVREVQR